MKTKRNKQYISFAIIGILISTISSCHEEQIEGADNLSANKSIIALTATISSPNQSRLVYDATALSTKWGINDAFNIYAQNDDSWGANTEFTLKQGEEGHNSAEFEGKNPGLASGYQAIYPTTAVLDMNNKINFSLLGQKQVGNDSKDHLSAYTLLATEEMSNLTSGVTFAYKLAMFKFDLNNIPAELGIPQQIILSSDATHSSYPFYSNYQQELTDKTPILALDLEGFSEETSPIKAYMMVVPTSINTGEQLAITIVGSKKTYSYSQQVGGTSSINYQAGYQYTFSVNNKWNEGMPITVPDNVYTVATEAIDPEAGSVTRSSSSVFIRNASHLKYVQENYAKYSEGRIIELSTDIIMAMGNKNWMPIGTNDTPFKAIFKGNNHTIKGIFINNTTSKNALGFFGYVSENGIVENLHVIGNIKSTYAENDAISVGLGGIVGRNSGTVKNCSFDGEISGYWLSFVGGIVGANWIGTVVDCTNYGNIIGVGMSSVGGIAGVNSSSILGCKNEGTISGKCVWVAINNIMWAAEGVGGIVGRMQSVNNPIIAGCYNSGTISAVITNKNDTYVGGIVGVNGFHVPNYRISSTVIGCGSIGKLLLMDYGYGGTNDSTIPPTIAIGGIAATNGNIASITDGGYITGCYNTGSVKGTSQSIVGAAIAKNISQIGTCFYVSSTASTFGTRISSINELNNKVSELNDVITLWNTKDQSLKCLYHFEANSSDAPKIKSGAPI